MTGTIKLYKNSSLGYQAHLVEVERYYSETERKRIITHWKRKYNGSLNLHYIQIAPGVDLTNKYAKK